MLKKVLAKIKLIAVLTGVKEHSDLYPRMFASFAAGQGVIVIIPIITLIYVAVNKNVPINFLFIIIVSTLCCVFIKARRKVS